MMLETGTLHCDPHPGNLLRTQDGRLCILDWGMTQQVPSDLQLGLLEFIANLQAENYEQGERATVPPFPAHCRRPRRCDRCAHAP